MFPVKFAATAIGDAPAHLAGALAQRWNSTALATVAHTR
jgi:hypothetical protein